MLFRSDDLFRVRAANEMGGLGQASNEVSKGDDNGTGIEDSNATKEVVERQFFNANGVRIHSQEPGLNIVRTTYSDGSIETTKELVK